MTTAQNGSERLRKTQKDLERPWGKTREDTTLSKKIAVIGAGVAGVAVARRLADRGCDVVVFDKGRSLAGRLSTRSHGDLRFDHGAPSVHADRPAFRALLAQLTEAGAAAAWPPQAEASVTGVPAMNALLDPLAADLDVRQSTAVTSIVHGADGWTLGIDGAAPLTGFDAVALAIPAEQTAALTAPLGLGWAERLGAVTYDPCMTMMVAFDTPLPIDTSAQPADGNDIAVQSRNAAKPGRPDHADQWVVHADLAWSERNLDTTKDAIAAALLERFAAANGLTSLPEPVYLAGHRWRFARVRDAVGQTHLYDPAKKIGAAGDWCLGPNAEHAFESGVFLAEALLADQ